MVDELFYLVDSAQPFNAAASFSNVSLFSIIPVNTRTSFPPTCGPNVTGACSIYSPHGIESNYKIPTNESWTSVPPGASTPVATRVATRAQVPDPHGERSSSPSAKTVALR